MNKKYNEKNGILKVLPKNEKMYVNLEPSYAKDASTGGIGLSR